MHPRKLIPWFFVLLLLAGFFGPVQIALATPPRSGLADSASAYELIAAMNALRVANGYPALIEDPIVNAVAQSSAEIMAANQMSWHIGDVRGRLAAAGYGGGATVWATENFAMGYSLGIDEIMAMWNDPDHLLPATVAAYCHVGAGTAKAVNGMTYYILQAAYTSNQSCGEYNRPTPGATVTPGGPAPTASFPQYIIPVKTATPGPDGKTYHQVQFGQSLWSIAIAYHITIRDLEVWNNISKDDKLQVGKKLFIPNSNTAGYATPTPVGMIVPATPDANGKIIHTVSAYQTLITIGQAYNVSVDKILALNGLKEEWPLQIGQKLLVNPGNVTPSATLRPLTPIEKLTPASDGKYYHTVKAGESLSYIANLYKVSVADLMAWNGLNGTSVIHPDQKLLLQVTPPATSTYTSGPPTATATRTRTPPPLIPTRSPTSAPPTPTDTPTPAPSSGGLPAGWQLFAGLGAVAVGLILFGLVSRKKP